ncbi:SusC/RagA family TonB-linked outer membrane protein [Bacteroidaceae bacterium]|jgi:TonB-linked SusC/RagA family outer membrane protein
MEKRFSALITMLLIGVYVAFAQQTITVNGTVVAADNDEPVIGASILVIGTTKGTITDIDGKFTLNDISANAQLKISYVGMISQTVKAVPKLTVTLKSDTQVIDEVVVTALGIQRQAKAIGYSTAKVDADQLTMAKGSDATAALSGKVSGLQINITSPRLDQETRITLRGARSFKGDNTALLVLDGVQTPTSFLQSLNPNDIENISVLKGASAAALYGSEAANGVLIVTTKNGTKGKPNITYSLTATMDEAAYLPKFQTRFGGGAPDPITGLPSMNGYIPDENQQYGPEFNGELINVGSPMADGTEDGFYLQLPYSYVKNGRKNFYEKGYGIQNDISYASSDDRGSMYLSYQRLDQSGIIANDDKVRQTVRFNASRNYKNFKASAKMSYTNTTYDLNNVSSSGIYNLINIPGNFDLADFKDWHKTGIGASPDEWINDYYTNPWWQTETYRRKIRQDRVVGSADLDFQATKWLRFTARAGINLSFNNRNYTNNAYRYSDWAKENIYYAASDLLSKLYTDSSISSKFNLDFMAFAEHKFNDDFAIKGMIGYSLQDNYYEYKEVGAESLALDDFFNVRNKMGELGGSNEWERSRKLGLFGSIDFSFRNWAFLQVTGRNDWTSLLDPEHWSFFYPSANLSVVLTDAIPSIKSDIMNHLKVRASAARVGTVNVGVYNLDNIANTADYFPYGTLAAYSISPNLRTRDIEPEFTTEYEVGAEIGLLRNRITLGIAAYVQTTTNQTTNISVPTSTGFSSRYINAGTMRGKGLELDLHLTPLLQFGDFFWNVSANATFLDTRVIELAGDATELNLNSDYAGYAIVGERYPMIKATDWKRTPDGRVIVDPVTGYPTAGDIIPCGTSDATVRLGLSSTMKWKGFTLGATFDYRGGHYTRFGIEYDMLFTGASYISGITGRQRFVFPNSAIEVGTDASGNPIYEDNTNVTVYDASKGFWNGIYKQGRANQVVSAASWRLRELSLGYDIPERLLKKVGFLQRASVSIVGRNLFMWTPSTNIWGDPDYTAAGNSNVSGMSGTRAAGTRSYGFNLLLSF